MGDQCVSVATLIALSGHEPPVSGEILDRVLTIGHLARAEVTQCKRAFIQRNVAMAEDLIDRDRDVNHLNREIFRLAADTGEDADTREWAMTMTLTARAFERVGDNAIAIGEQTATSSPATTTTSPTPHHPPRPTPRPPRPHSRTSRPSGCEDPVSGVASQRVRGAPGP
jgi:phosphate uptake regulator